MVQIHGGQRDNLVENETAERLLFIGDNTFFMIQGNLEIARPVLSLQQPVSKDAVIVDVTVLGGNQISVGGDHIEDGLLRQSLQCPLEQNR